MDVLSPLMLLVIHAVVVVLPLTVGMLAFRRLLFSQTTNAWIYAATCLFASITAIALLPWAIGIATTSSVFFLFSAISPIIWLTVVMACDQERIAPHYDANNAEGDEAKKELVMTFRPRPLILERPEWPDAPIPVFRHLSVPVATIPASANHYDDDEETPKSLTSIVLGMRRNKNSDGRRPKLLPAPVDVDTGLPFLPPK